MTDAELIERFESDAVPSDSFHHADHVRLAFAYLSENPPLQALEKFTAALKQFATARGKPQLYHDLFPVSTSSALSCIDNNVMITGRHRLSLRRPLKSMAPVTS